MKTYQELENGTSFDWWEALEEASHWEEEDDSVAWRNLTARAGSWVTCACGNQCSIIPRDKEGEPLDEELSELGMDFYSFVGARCITEAMFVLCAIEDRSAELIREIKMNKV